MTKKDYILIAMTIKKITSKKARLETSKLFATMLSQDNERFNKDKFINACII